MINTNKRSPEYWKEKLPTDVYEVAFEKGTEAPFMGKYWNNHEIGMYACAVCGQPLFSSDAKFDSGTGWPSFDQPMSKEHIELREDSSHGMHRTEVICKHCGAHLGHLFTDGPKETTGMRYCLNSCVLHFKKKE